MKQSIIVIDNGKSDYRDALKEQEKLFNQAINEKHEGRQPKHHLLLNEHNPVFTLGKHGEEQNILLPIELLKEKGIQVHHIARGGDVTYHGPGQWTIYPIFDLEELEMGVRAYVEALEEVAIRVMAHYGLEGIRIPGASGVWMEKEGKAPVKICAIGIQASRYVTMHGIAFNVSTPPEAYQWINPCGFTDRGVSNISIESGKEISMEEAKEQLLKAFSEVFDRPLSL